MRRCCASSRWRSCGKGSRGGGLGALFCFCLRPMWSFVCVGGDDVSTSEAASDYDIDIDIDLIATAAASPTHLSLSRIAPSLVTPCH